MSKILIVDDSSSFRDTLRADLTAAGHQACEAAHGEEGLRRFRTEGPFDLIICDVNMPERDGLSMAEAIRAEPSGRATPIFVLSAECSAAEKQHGRAVGVTAWIVKPYSRATLLAAIAQITPQAPLNARSAV